MQEEVTQGAVAICVEATKMSADLLQKAIKKVLEEIEKGKAKAAGPRKGRQTIRQLMKQNTGVSNIEITDQNIKAFSSTAKQQELCLWLQAEFPGGVGAMPALPFPPLQKVRR